MAEHRVHLRACRSAAAPVAYADVPRVALAAAMLLALATCNENAIAEQDKTLAGTIEVCSSCHGRNGRSASSTFPDLAGQQKDYLVAQLKAFRDHKRADPHARTYMWGMAAGLNDAMINRLAAYYSAQKPAAGSAQDPMKVAAGKTIYDQGVAEKNVPPCMACHGAKAEGAGTVPRLAGQHRNSLRRQLLAFAADQRANAIMHQESMNLTRRQIDNVSAYLAAQ